MAQEATDGTDRDAWHVCAYRRLHALGAALVWTVFDSDASGAVGGRRGRGGAAPTPAAGRRFGRSARAGSRAAATAASTRASFSKRGSPASLYGAGRTRS